MGYRDEELLRMRQKIEEFKKQQTAEETIEQECTQSIHDPVVYITKLPVEFKDRPLLEDRIKMRIPVDFELVPPEIVDQIFYMQSKPQIVYADHDGTHVQPTVHLYFGWKNGGWKPPLHVSVYEEV